MSDGLAALYQTVHIIKDKGRLEFRVEAEILPSMNQITYYMGCSEGYEV